MKRKEKVADRKLLTFQSFGCFDLTWNVTQYRYNVTEFNTLCFWHQSGPCRDQLVSRFVWIAQRLRWSFILLYNKLKLGNCCSPLFLSQSRKYLAIVSCHFSFDSSTCHFHGDELSDVCGWGWAECTTKLIFFASFLHVSQSSFCDFISVDLFFSLILSQSSECGRDKITELS